MFPESLGSKNRYRPRAIWAVGAGSPGYGWNGPRTDSSGRSALSGAGGEAAAKRVDSSEVPSRTRNPTMVSISSAVRMSVKFGSMTPLGQDPSGQAGAIKALGSTIEARMYSAAAAGGVRVAASTPIVDRFGPTVPVAPGMPGMVWHPVQPALLIAAMTAPEATSSSGAPDPGPALVDVVVAAGSEPVTTISRESRNTMDRGTMTAAERRPPSASPMNRNSRFDSRAKPTPQSVRVGRLGDSPAAGVLIRYGNAGTYTVDALSRSGRMPLRQRGVRIPSKQSSNDLDRNDWLVIGAAVGFSVPLLVFTVIVSFVHFTSEPTILAAPGVVATTAPATPTTATPSSTGSTEGSVSTSEVTEADIGIDAVTLSTALGCTACHSIDGTVVVGPSWLGLAGSERSLEDGTTILADDDYLLESIVDPNARIAAGFLANLMPTDFGDRLSDVELQALVEYIQSLS